MLLLLPSEEDSQPGFRSTAMNSRLKETCRKQGEGRMWGGGQDRGSGGVGRLEGKLGARLVPTRALGTYSQGTIKDVHTAVHTSLAAPGPPREGEQAGEKRAESETVRGRSEASAPRPTAWRESHGNTERGAKGLEGMKVEI